MFFQDDGAILSSDSSAPVAIMEHLSNKNSGMDLVKLTLFFCLLIVYFFFVYFLGMDLVKLTDICGGGTSTEMANQNVLLSNLQKLEDAGKMITGSSR